MTERVAQALNAAHGLAVRRQNTDVGVEHLLAALLEQDQGLTPTILEKAGVDPQTIGRRVERELERLPRVVGTQPDRVYLAAALTRLLNTAQDESKALSDDYVSVEHLLLAMAGDG
ncbi:MAG: type VI secretion system ATPase TssH, partial [bacterium]|nr:type VI secretion system ATPase TssH [bacterium]